MSYTLLRPTQRLHGIGIHSGLKSWVEIHPNHQFSGIYFQSSEVGIQPRQQQHQATYTNVTSTQFRTELNHSIQTIEHLLSGLKGLNCTNCFCVFNGREIPILDGSSQGFVQAVKQSGMVLLPSQRKRKILRILRECTVKGDENAEITIQSTKSNRLFIDISIDFNQIKEDFQYDSSIHDSIYYEKEIAPARTFVMDSDVTKLRTLKFGLGGNADNCVIFSSKTNEPLNTKLRFPNERVRHKLLDLLGDLMLTGCDDIFGEIHANRPGHSLTHKLLVNIFSEKDNYEILEV
jgi:UDP-3-O-[3-hydroxymyristoyl] N-acetylglucosamine deacetylase